MRFILNGCDISFIAEAPEDMTVKQLVEQADRIEPYWCACGVCKDTEYKNVPTEIFFDYNDVRKASDDVSCKIRDNKDDNKVNDIKEMVQEEKSTGDFCMNCTFACNMDKEDYYYCLLKGLAVTYKFNTCNKYEKENNTNIDKDKKSMSKDYSNLEGLICNVKESIKNAYDKGYKQGFKDGTKSEYEHDHAIVKAYNDGQAYILDKIRADIEKITSRYTISREHGAMGHVEWSDRLIKESEILEIIDKYKDVKEGSN